MSTAFGAQWVGATEQLPPPLEDEATATFLAGLAETEAPEEGGLYSGLPPPGQGSPVLPVNTPSPAAPAAPAAAAVPEIQGVNLFPTMTDMQLDDPKAKDLVQLFKRHELAEAHQKTFLKKRVYTPLLFYKVGHDEKDCRTALRQSLFATMLLP